MNGKRHGNGSLSGVCGSYEGGFVNDKLEGKGIMAVFGISRYDGDFVNGKYEGKGKYIFLNGNVYVGDFVNGKRHGIGGMTFTDGARYEGDFVNDERHGIGCEMNKNGEILRHGYYEHGKFDTSTAIDRPATPEISSSSSVPAPRIVLYKSC